MLNVFPAVHCSPLSYFTARLVSLVLVGFALVVSSSAQAQEAEVSSVKFANVRTPTGSTGNWYEADIALEVRPPPSAPGRMISRLRVTLTVGFELPAPAGGERRIEFYRANAECVALEAGRANRDALWETEQLARQQTAAAAEAARLAFNTIHPTLKLLYPGRKGLIRSFFLREDSEPNTKAE